MSLLMHPDISGQLARDRIASLRADAERYRQARPLLARWRPARFVDPAGDLSRGAAADPEPAKAGRAA
jgi:hypothetical protein